MSRDSRLLLYFPQWQGSGDEDKIFHGSKILKSILEDDISAELTSIAVPAQFEMEDEQASQKAGDDWIRNHSILSLQYQDAASTIAARSPSKIFTLGGDCGIELAPIRYLNSIYGEDLAVIWLDAHADLNTPSTSPSKTFHGMILRALLENFEPATYSPGEPGVNLIPDFVTSTSTTPLRPNQVFLAGVRDLDPAEQEYIARQDVPIVKCEELERHQGQALLSLLRRGRFKKVYIHIDADVLSLNDFDSVMCPTAGGISTQTLKAVIKDIKEGEGICVVGGSLVEVIKKNDDNVPYRDIATIFTSFWLE
ncbi:arginase family protein [Aspergillus lucknowensis]|uniref:Arginase n=1 Tax=Aspergillus lucknowensis TaxID=176173 RepID=A0ABR4LY86_9EURO